MWLTLHQPPRLCALLFNLPKICPKYTNLFFPPLNGTLLQCCTITRFSFMSFSVCRLTMSVIKIRHFSLFRSSSPPTHARQPQLLHAAVKLCSSSVLQSKLLLLEHLWEMWRCTTEGPHKNSHVTDMCVCVCLTVAVRDIFNPFTPSVYQNRSPEQVRSHCVQVWVIWCEVAGLFKSHRVTLASQHCIYRSATGC